MAAEKLSGQVQFDVLMSPLERLVGEENTEGTGEWSGEWEEMSRVYFPEVKRKVYLRKREGSRMDSAIWYGKPRGMLAPSVAPSVGAVWVPGGVMLEWKAGEEVGMPVEAALSRWDLVDFWLLQTYCQQMVEGLLKAASVGVDLGRGCWAFEVGNG